MKYLRFVGWLALTVTGLTLLAGSVHTLFGYVAPALGVSFNRATASGYSMEVTLSFLSFLLVLWRLLWALEVCENIYDAWHLLKTRTAALSLGLAGVVGMIFTNRLFWWMKHMFTSEAYNHTEYSGAANSVIMSMLMCVLVYALHAEPDRHALLDERDNLLFGGLSAALILWVIGVIAFAAGGFLYNPQF